MINGWSDVVEDAKFEILRSNFLWVQVGIPIVRFFFHLDHFCGWGIFMVSGWPDVVDDAKFEFY